MSIRDRNYAEALRGIIREEILLAKEAEAAAVENFEIEDYRESIETIISEYINYNVTVNIEA
jgi:hypothetical protein